MKFIDIRPGDMWVDDINYPERIFFCVSAEMGPYETVEVIWQVIRSIVNPHAFFVERLHKFTEQRRGSAIVRNGIIYRQQ